ncbi:MAG: Ig-like domain-containing protein, partial [Luteolibacter sp.]
NYNGADSFTFKVNDGVADSAPAVVSIAVASINDAPVAAAQSVNLDEDTSLAIALAGADVDGDPLGYTVTVGPQHGVLSGTGWNRTYTPAADYHGSDSFTFVANDGGANSAPAVVSITVAPVDHNKFGTWLSSFGLSGGPGDDPDHDSINNAVEYVIGGNPATHSDVNLLPTITIVSADPDGNSINSNYLLFTYRRTDSAHSDPNTTIQVQWGTSLSGAWNNASGTSGVVVLENDNGAGEAIDLVSVYIPRSLAANGLLFARLAVSINVPAPANLPPVAQGQSMAMNEDASMAVTLAATDPNNSDPLTYAIVSAPQHGALTGTAPNLTYTPAPNYFGADSFTFKANDGTVDSAVATVSITVNPQEEFNQWMSSFGLTAGPGADSDGDSISNIVEYVIGGNPANHPDAGLLPTVSMVTADPDGNTVNDNYLLFTYRRTDVVNTDPSMTIQVQWGTSLTGVWTNTSGTTGVVILQNNDAAGVGVDIVSVYIPRSLAVNGKLFARLSASVVIP